VLGVLLACAAGALMLAAPQEPPAVAAPSSVATPAPRAAAAPATSAASPVIISSPSADAYVSGVTMLRVAIDSSVAAKAVQFFVDGRQFCSVTEAPFECEWDAGSTVSAHLIRVVVTPENGDRIVRNLRTKGIGYADRVNVEAIQVTVTVSDDAGRFVAGLPRPSFRVFEDGKPQPITYFASQDVPLELICAVDISGSMTTAMPKLKKAVKEFLVAVPPKDQVSLCWEFPMSTAAPLVSTARSGPLSEGSPPVEHPPTARAPIARASAARVEQRCSIFRPSPRCTRR